MQESNKGQLEVLNYLSKGNQFVLYAYRKISKISQAIYIITDTIKDAESLKWTLRKTAAEMLPLKHFLDEQNVFNNLERVLLELEGLLEFARLTKIMSEMNTGIVQNEIRRLLMEIREGNHGAPGSELRYPFFDVEKSSSILSEHVFGNPSKEAHQYKSHKGRSVLYDFYNRSHAHNNSDKVVGMVAQKDKSERRDDVIKVIKAKGEVTIKDITDQIKDCSEKTIQRELTAMVLSGIIKKTGERRWSRYSMS